MKLRPFLESIVVLFVGPQTLKRQTTNRQSAIETRPDAETERLLAKRRNDVSASNSVIWST